jgi:hypothetical protein
MAALTFLGLTLALDPRPGGGWIVLPPAASGSDRYWKRGDLSIFGSPGNWTLDCKPTSLTLDKLDVLLEIEDLELVAKGDDFRPAASLNSNAVSLRFGPSGGPRATRVGPIRLDDNNATIGFDAGDPTARGLYRTDFGFASGSVSDQDEAVWLGLSKNSRIAIDLRRKLFAFPPGTVEGRLSARNPKGAFKSVIFINKGLIEVPFSESVAGTDRAFELALQPGQAGPLNVDPHSGAPSIELLSGVLALSLRRTTGPGALVTNAAIRPASGGRCEYRFNALRNSRNRAERWSTEQSVDLVFRTLEDGRWHSALLAPQGAKTTPPRFRRIEEPPIGGNALPMHSWFGSSHFDMPVAAEAVLICSEASTTSLKPTVGWLDPKLQRRATRPWFKLGIGVAFEHTRPGEAWRGQTQLWRFESKSSGGAAPLTSRSTWADGEVSPPPKGSPLLAANEEVNAAFRAMQLQEKQSQHETGIADQTGPNGSAPGAPFIREIVPNGDVLVGEVRLAKHNRSFAIAAPRLAASGAAAAAPGLMRFPVTLPQGEAMEFAVAWPALQTSPGKLPWVWLDGLSEWAGMVAGSIDPDAPIAIADLLKDLAYRPTDFPLAIFKLTRTRRLNELLGDLARDLKGNAATEFDKKRKAVITTIGEVDSTVLDPSWVGLVLFDVAIDFEAFPMLKAVMPSDPQSAPRFAFVSVVPRDPAHGAKEIAMSASVDWRNNNANVSPPAPPDQEGTFWPRSLNIAFKDRKLTRFRSEAQLTLHSFLGLKAADLSKRTINIIGSAQRTAGTGQSDGQFALRFAAEVPNGGRIPIFPLGKPEESNKTFIKTIWFRRVEIIDAPSGTSRKAEIDIDGSIEFQKPDFDFGQSGFFKKLSDLSVDFGNLRIELQDFGSLKAQLLKIKYPSLRFNVDFPHMALLGSALKLKFNQLILDWGNGAGAFNFGQFPSLGLPSTGSLDLSLPKIILRGRIDFGSLPDLFARTLSGFNLDGVFALNFDSNGLPMGLPYVGIGGFGFDRLNFDFSFIRLQIEQLALGPAPWPSPVTGSALSIVNASLDILDVKVLKNGNGAFFSSDAESGNGFWAAFLGVDLSLLNLEWGFVGRNIDFPADLPKELLSPPLADAQEENFKSVAKSLHSAWSDGRIRPASGSTARGWTFAAGLSAFEGSFRGRALFQDGGFMGLALYGEALRKLLGWNFVFVGLYRKNITPGEDYFYFSVTLPPMSFGSMRFTGGTIAAEIFTSGDFTFDFGFPWRSASGGRQWERTFGAIVTPGQASGGFYVRKRRSHNPNTGSKELTVGGGVAYQWGLGAAFGNGVFQVWVRIGLYVIVEGEIVLNYKSTNDVRIVAFKLQGAVGILLEGEGKIDWWVISVRVGVRASAEIRASLLWDSRTGDNRVLMPIEAELSVSAHAEACIGGGCARICRGISVNLNIPVRYQLQFG